MSKIINTIPLLTAFLFTLSAQANILYTNDFQSGEMDEWLSDRKSASKIELSSYQQNKTLQLKQSTFALTPIKTTGYKNTRYSVTLYGLSLEKNDECRAEISVDQGKSWKLITKLKNGQDDGITPVFGNLFYESADNKEQILFRLISTGGESNDSCYFDDIKVTGEKQYDLKHGSYGKKGFSFDFINGSEEFNKPVKTLFFKKPDNARPVTHQFEGEFIYKGNESHYLELIDDTFSSYSKNGKYKLNQLPDFNIFFVQSDDDLIPMKRGPQLTNHPYWEIMFEPGKVWDEPTDKGYSRAAIPFALQEKGANCIHNGLMTFLYKTDGSISRTIFQIGNETCAYLKFDMLGSINVTYKPQANGNAAQIVSAFRREQNNRLPTKSIKELNADYSSVNTKGFGSENEIHPSVMTNFGVVVDGVNYVGECNTRFGPYPYCDVMILPSYSTAKSINALAYIRMAKLEPSIKGKIISELVPECNRSQWKDVTIEHALNMSTGNYISEGYEVDEFVSILPFFDSLTHKGKIKDACKFKRKAKPGSKWVYHTTDTYIYGTALNNFWKTKKGQAADYYNDILIPIWDEIGLSPLMNFTRRTYDDRKQPYAGYGLSYQRNDIAKLATSLLSNEKNKKLLNQYFDMNEFDIAMQMNASDRGLSVSENINYKHAFWAWNVKELLGCSQSTWIPFMSGYGGITIALMPNDIVYYYFSDNHDYRWQEAVKAANQIRPLCS